MLRSNDSHDRITALSLRGVPVTGAPNKVQFLGIAAGSAGELETQLILAARLGYLNEGTVAGVLGMHAEVERMLAALIRTLKTKIHTR